jgi:hypothetical protein
MATTTKHPQFLGGPKDGDAVSPTQVGDSEYWYRVAWDSVTVHNYVRRADGSFEYRGVT